MVADSDRFGELATERVGAEVKGVDLDLFRLSFALSRTATRFVRRVESTVHRPAGLTWAGFRVLFTVWACGSMESHQIAHLSGLSRASVSSAVNTLERDGMVARSRESTDRRLVTVSLTGRGERSGQRRICGPAPAGGSPLRRAGGRRGCGTHQNARAGPGHTMAGRRGVIRP